jgi:competence protein ComGF|tara:strand:+ start:162 stop:743 length:582 start_codon:yes stop_codon:yes gene_type:complete
VISHDQIKIKVFKNVIDKQKQEELKTLMLENRIFPWYFIKNVSDSKSDSKQARPGMQHEFCSIKKGINSKYFNDVTCIVNFMKKDKIEVLRTNSFLQFPNPFLKSYDTPHYDLPQIKEKYTVFLYYLISSDGDTIFFDKNKKIIKKVTPEQGTAVLFDGSYLHTAYQPYKNIRCVINFNITGTYEENLKYANS